MPTIMKMLESYHSLITLNRGHDYGDEDIYVRIIVTKKGFLRTTGTILFNRQNRERGSELQKNDNSPTSL